MTADIELLPLPRTLQHADDADLATHVQDYARANVAHATAAKDAEIEAQRAVPEGVLVWVRNKRTLLSARMSAGEFHAQEALDMAMLSRLEVFLAAPSPEQENGNG